MDKIIVKGLKVFAYHGVNPEEKRDGQNFIMDITAAVDLSAPCVSDNLEDTVSYAKLLKTAARVMTERSYDLLERVAGRVAEQIFADFPPVMELEILLKKPEAPIQADFEYTAVSIHRRRSDCIEKSGNRFGI
ncbi:dihydroneopterin aldolase [Clostridium minihomine]|uniref:dihydroneopterin aldolase n=1 Tax=Clostridium minihomine TaxID=2045012 RepID=UPI000C75BDF7|nr:dihydroneopterin aldolase [Clostridium minihomine]